jgi:glycosyltransferase involved in cell wall biosynthesis
LRIVVVEPDLEENGAIRVDLERVRRWRHLGANVVLVALECGEEKDRAPVPAGVDVRFVTRRPRRFRHVYALGLVKVWWLARRADVVMSGREMQFGVLLASTAARAARRPLAVTMHSWLEKAMAEHVEPRFREATRKAVRTADLVVCVSEGLTTAALEAGVPGERVRVVKNGIDAEEVRRLALLAPEVALPDGPLVVGCGRLNDEKGFDTLVRAHARALALGAPAHSIVVVGEGPRRDLLVELAEELGVAGTVSFPGFTRNPWAVMGRADLFVLPSRFEGLTLTLLEALALAVPMAASRCAGPEELLEGGTFGMLFPLEDVEALATSIRDHLRSPDDLRRRAAAGPALVAERYSVASAAQQHLDLIEALVSSRRRAT